MVVNIDIQIIQWRDIDSNKNIGSDSYCSCVVGITSTKICCTHFQRFCTISFWCLLPAATKLGQGNVFTGVCDSVNRGGVLPQCMLGYTPRVGTPPPWEQTPREQTPQSRHHPPGADPRSRNPLEQRPPPWVAEASIRSTSGMHSCCYTYVIFPEILVINMSE